MNQGEWFNSSSHLVGAILALVGAVVLVLTAVDSGDPLKIVSFAIYGTTLFLLYLVSTLYHSAGARYKPLLRIFDHQAIYLLIAGTYTPFTLVTLRGHVGWWLFAVTWGIALSGIVLETVPYRGKRYLPVVIYLVMGWLVLFALDPLVRALAPAGFGWLVSGGVLYSLGVIFFILDHWDRRWHGVWHVFVLAGSISHYVAILRYV